jgi:hypothetical protein
MRALVEAGVTAAADMGSMDASSTNVNNKEMILFLIAFLLLIVNFP